MHNLEYGTFNLPKPDLNIILHVTAELAQQLVDKKDVSVRTYVNGAKRDILEADLDHLKKAEKTYLEISELFPNTKLVECMENQELLDIEQIHGLIWNHIITLIGPASNFQS